MHNSFLLHLKQCACSFGYEPMQTCATFNLSNTSGAKGVLPGAVYGIAAILDEHQAHALEVEAREKGCLKTPLSHIKRIYLDEVVAAIPLYWGKDAAVGFRLYRHLLDKNPKAGCLGGQFYENLADKDLLLASLPVNDFIGFEKHIEKQYPPLLFNVKASNIGNFVPVRRLG